MSNNTITPRGRRVPRASVEAQAQTRTGRSSNLPTPRPTNRNKPTRSRGRAWRKSLMGPGRGARSRTLDARQQAVAMPTQIALQALLDMGKRQDTNAGSKTRMVLSEQDVKDYNAFKGVKEAYLSTAPFLQPAALNPQYAPQLNDPSSPFNQLIRRANLVTFLYLVFSSGPDSEGHRRRDAATKLTEAAMHFLTLVVPNETQIHDGVLAMLTGLRIQTYLSHLATSREPYPPSEFLGSPLSTYLSQEKLLDNRSAAIRFTALQNDALAAIESTEADLEVLETQYRWNDLVQELRNYCENVVADGSFNLESGRSDDESVDDDVVTEEEEESARRLTSSDATPRGPQTPRATIVPKSLKKSAKKAVAPVQQTTQETPSDVDELLSDSALANLEVASQSDVDSLEEEHEVEERLRYSSADAETADATATESDSYETVGTVQRRHVRAFRALEEGSEMSQTASIYQDGELGESTEAKKPTMAAQMRALQRSLSDEPSTLEEEDKEDSLGPMPTRAKEISLFLKESTSELSTPETQAEEETLGLHQASRAQDLRQAIAEFSDEDNEEVDELDFKVEVEEHALSIETTPRAQRRDANDDGMVTRLAFGQGNQLQRVPVDSNAVARSLLVRQANAERLRFDSQGGEDEDEDDQVKSPRKNQRAATTTKGKGKAKGKEKQATSPQAVEQGRGQVSRGGLRTELLALEDEDSDRSAEEERERERGTVELEEERSRSRQGNDNDYQNDPFIDDREYGGGNESLEPETFRGFDKESTVSSLEVHQVSGRDRKGKGKERAREEEKETPTGTPIVTLDPDNELTIYLENRRREVLDAQDQGVGTSSGSMQRASGSQKKSRRDRPEASGSAEGFETDQSSVDDEVRRRNRRAQRQVVDDESDGDDRRRRRKEAVAGPKPPSKKQSRVESDSDDSDEQANAPMRDFLKATHTRKRPQYEGVVLSSDTSDSDDMPPEPPWCHNIYRQNRNIPGARIAWSYEEDRCLTEAMRHHQCRWSQIMALHGPQGTINDILKHRTSMSLRDRAVNLKVNLVKQRLRVPSYLKPGQFVITVSGLVYMPVARSPLSFSFISCFINSHITMHTPSLALVLLGLTSAVSAIAVGEPNPATPKAHTQQLEAFCKKFTTSCWSTVKTKSAGLHRCYWNKKEDSVKTFCGEVKVVTEVINSTGHVNATVQKTELPKDGKVSLPTHLVHVHKEVRKFKLFDYTPKVLKHLSANATTPTRQILKYTKEDTRFKNATRERLEGRVVRVIKAPKHALRPERLWKVLA
ncbi:BZ3500_MvSof-1268-A1-R1_Chr12-3g04007 [Microbotryum saponariae]|uniref:BZ3500_MvSof-1268-A1-R1_Chr12-3g04007 protein n=1 Tax=Microbotryum saponariae TaxID=289078 RepID=A0A2X0KR42_9BASI|nr:BZ3500_MvSof-1268-A1-R1_Chr12-3g04007 [Microbotryum saponariae]SDA02525.1 BZ3501_MvSof-1269-A2-R1_Chr12-3g03662 [Microbotryum saponariae]